MNATSSFLSNFIMSCHAGSCVWVATTQGITTFFQPQVLPAPCSKRCSFVWRIAHWKIHMVHLSWRFGESDHTQNNQKKHEAVICPSSLTWNLKSFSPWKTRFLLEAIIFRILVKTSGVYLVIGPFPLRPCFYVISAENSVFRDEFAES